MCYGVPGAVIFFRAGGGGGLAWVTVFDEWAEVDHEEVVVQHIKDGLPGETGGKGCHGCEDVVFGHCCDGGDGESEARRFRDGDFVCGVKCLITCLKNFK